MADIKASKMHVTFVYQHINNIASHQHQTQAATTHYYFVRYVQISACVFCYSFIFFTVLPIWVHGVWVHCMYISIPQRPITSLLLSFYFFHTRSIFLSTLYEIYKPLENCWELKKTNQRELFVFSWTLIYFMIFSKKKERTHRH